MNRNKKFALLTVFICLVVVLQIIATFINFGGFPITLTLIPIIISGVVLGKKEAAIVGFSFGVITSIMVITGLDPSGSLMLSINPIITIITCLLKGTLAGYLSASVYNLIQNKKVGLIVSSAIAPIINTLTLTISIILFFEGTFQTFIMMFITINFLIELITNILLAPGLSVILTNKFIKK